MAPTRGEVATGRRFFEGTALLIGPRMSIARFVGPKTVLAFAVALAMSSSAGAEWLLSPVSAMRAPGTGSGVLG